MSLNERKRDIKRLKERAAERRAEAGKAKKK